MNYYRITFKDKQKYVKSTLGMYDTVKAFYPDILAGQHVSGFVRRFYSASKRGFIFARLLTSEDIPNNARFYSIKRSA